MELFMGRLIRKQTEIFRPIVIPNTIAMMHYFFRFKTATKFFLHNKTRPSHIRTRFLIMKRALRFENKHITIFRMLPLSAFIIRMFGAYKASFQFSAYFLFSLLGMFKAFWQTTAKVFVAFLKTALWRMFTFKAHGDISIAYLRKVVKVNFV